MSKALIHKALNKSLRKNRVRSRVSGTAERPRLTVTISNIHVSAQLIDDVAGKTLVSATTVGSKLKGSKTELAAKIGEEIAKKTKKAKINAVVRYAHSQRRSYQGCYSMCKPLRKRPNYQGSSFAKAQ